jgi:hypothetical protein
MTPPPTLQELIETVRADAPGESPLQQLTQASKTASDLEDVTDALLGHFVDRCRRQGHSWSEISAALGVTKQAAHKRFTPPSAPTMERFTPRARQVVLAAANEARRFGSPEVRSEHLLLAQFDQPQGIAAVVLADLGITAERILVQLGATPAAAPKGTRSEDQIPFSGDGKAVLQRALMEALQLGHNYIGTEHLLLGAFADPPTAATNALVELGADRDDVAARIEQILAQYKK